MRINRRFLYAGTFLVALGAVLVAADLGAIDLGVVRDALRLWPIALVLLGVALVVRRSPVALPVGLLAAGAPGLVLGGAIAIGPRFVTDCGLPDAAAGAPEVRQGTFDVPATVSIDTACGTLDVTTADGSSWSATVANGHARQADVSGDARSLTVSDANVDGWPGFDAGRDHWQVTLPTSPIRHLSTTTNAGDSRIDLSGAQLDMLELTANAAQVRLDLTGTSLRQLTAKANFSALTIELPGASDLMGDLRVNAGDLRLCSPAGVGLRVNGRGFADGFAVDGVHPRDLSYESADYATATHHIDLSVNASFGSVEINPIGGCK